MTDITPYDAIPVETDAGEPARPQLLLLATALHDLGKTGGGVDETATHARRGVEVDEHRLGLGQLGLGLVALLLVDW